jgi:MFS family permease
VTEWSPIASRRTAGLTPEAAPESAAIAPLLAARALRDFGDGFAVVLLPAYLLGIGLSPWQVGVISSAALFGSSLLTLAIGILGARHDRRRLLLMAAVLMAATGIAFSVAETYAILLAIAFVGTINPSAGSVSVFVPLEHAVLSRAVAAKARTSLFSRYSLIGALAGAGGALSAAAPDLLGREGVEEMTAIKAMFVFYALLGVAGCLIYRRMPQRPLLTDDLAPSTLGPSRKIVFKLAALFSLDAFAGGFVVQSLLALWLFQKFDMSLAAASLFFFWSGVLSAFSFPVAAWLSRRIGLVNTMVFTHIPSSLCLILAAFAPTLWLALALLLVRAALSQMDVPTRSSYVMAVVTEAERIAAASVTSAPRSLAAALSPSIAGAMLGGGLVAGPFIICGVLKIAYDLLLLVQFRHIKPPEEERARPRPHRA